MADIDDRELCPDGACIGVIGDDGRCKECGTPRVGESVSAVGVASAVEVEVASEVVDDDDRDEDDRALCVDDLCVGLIGADGFCRECGKPGPGASSGDPRTRGLRSEAEIADEVAENVAKGDLPAAPESFDDRRLCPDGACIGVIGKNGKCRECGRAG